MWIFRMNAITAGDWAALTVTTGMRVELMSSLKMNCSPETLLFHAHRVTAQRVTLSGHTTGCVSGVTLI